jgi:hypothetical protein
MSGTARAEDCMGANENLAVHVRCADAEDRHDLSHHSELATDDAVVCRWTTSGTPVIIQQLG